MRLAGLGKRTNLGDYTERVGFDLPGSCQHLGDYSGTRIKVKCDINSNRESLKPLHQCDIHRRCIPGWSGPWPLEQDHESKLFKICQLCEDYSQH